MRLHFLSSSKAKNYGSTSGAGGPRDSIPSQAGALRSRGGLGHPTVPQTVRSPAGRDSALPFPSLASLCGGWALALVESGSKVLEKEGLDPSQGWPCHTMPPSHWHGGCLVSVMEDRVLDLPFQEQSTPAGTGLPEHATCAWRHTLSRCIPTSALTDEALRSERSPQGHTLNGMDRFRVQFDLCKLD